MGWLCGSPQPQGQWPAATCNSPHVLGSSVPSRQSSSSLHIRDSKIHFPSSHRTMPGGQGATAHTTHVRRANPYQGGHQGYRGSQACGEAPQSINRFLGCLPPPQVELEPRKAKYTPYFTHGLDRSHPIAEHPGCPLTADIFIRGIATVINPVALPLGHDAHPVPTLPLPGQTGLLGTPLLIPAILAVLVPIAQLPVRDAVVGARTLHLLCPTH